MISRREVVTAGVLGTLATTGTANAESASQDADVVQQLRAVQNEIANLRTSLERVLVGPSLSTGSIGEIREKFIVHLRASGKFPDFLEVGMNLFMDVYDWHVRHQQQIQIVRVAEGRFAIQFMFTQLIARYEQDRNHIGVPFDKA
jgi:hypothetical protein